jgi:hypothetical protein
VKAAIIGTGRMAKGFATALAPKQEQTASALAEDMRFHPVDAGP